MLHSMSHRGITKETYLQISGRTEDELLAEARPDAEQALRREAVLAAVIEAESIEPSDGDLLDALQATAARENTSPEKLMARLDKAGPARRAARRPRSACGDRADRRTRDADRPRAGQGAREALDPRQGLVGAAR